MKARSTASPHHDGDLAGCPLTKRHRLRMRVVFWLFLLVFVRIGARLVELHVTPAYDFSMEDQAHIGEVFIQAPRGNIFDRDGLLLATDELAPSLWADPMRLADPYGAAHELGRRLNLDAETLLASLTLRSSNGNLRRFVWIKRRMEPQELQALGDLKEIAEQGLGFQYEPVRSYPQRELAAHVLGFVDRERVRCEGVEFAYDTYLRSAPGKRRALKDSDKVLLPSLTIEYEPPKHGADVVLTIDTVLQRSLERELDRVITRCNATRAMGIFMDPDTGAVLALACRPAFDPNRYWEFDDEARRNRVVLDVFEPGSAFKIVTASAAFEEGIIASPDDLVNCENGLFRPYGSRVIRDFHKLGVVTFADAFAESSNIAMVKIAALLGETTLESWIRLFGFGEETGSDFRPESRGVFRPVAEWTRASIVSLPIGQELSVTTLQLARAFAAIANGGYLVTPHVVQQVISMEGEVLYEFEAQERRRILHEETARLFQQLCHRVVTHGTGSYANILEFRVAGKTGTAQIAKPDGTGYYADRFTTIFAGFAPVSSPRICGVIVVHEPLIRLHYGGYVCGPVFQKVVRQALIRMHCPQDPVLEKVPVRAQLLDDADTVIARYEADSLEPSRDEVLISLGGLKLAASQPDISSDVPRLPSFIGMTRPQAREKIAALGLPWTARDSGWVVYQDPPAGTPLYEVSVCRLIFSNRQVGTEKSNRSNSPFDGTGSR